MRKRRLALAALPVLFIGLAAAKAKAKENVALEIVLEKPEAKLSEEIKTGFKLVNKGSEPVWVNQRFKLGTAKAVPEQREVILEVKAEDGTPVEMKSTDYVSGLPKSDYFKLLKPGEEASTERKWNLKDLAKIEKPGTYEITAIYENSFGKELGLDVFKGKSAASVKVKVVEG